MIDHQCGVFFWVSVCSWKFVVNEEKMSVTRRRKRSRWLLCVIILVKITNVQNTNALTHSFPLPHSDITGTAVIITLISSAFFWVSVCYYSGKDHESTEHQCTHSFPLPHSDNTGTAVNTRLSSALAECLCIIILVRIYIYLQNLQPHTVHNYYKCMIVFIRLWILAGPQDWRSVWHATCFPFLMTKDGWNGCV